MQIAAKAGRGVGSAGGHCPLSIQVPDWRARRALVAVLPVREWQRLWCLARQRLVVLLWSEVPRRVQD